MNRLFYDALAWPSGAGGGGEKEQYPEEFHKAYIKAAKEFEPINRNSNVRSHFCSGARWAYRHLSPSPGRPASHQAELIQKQKEYIEFLGKHVSDNASFMHVHGILTPQNEVEKGIQFRKEIAELEAIPPSLPSEQVEGKRFGNISRRIHPATESTDRILPFLPPSVEADQRQARRRGLKAFDDSMKNTLGELIQPEENPFAETDADQQVPEEIVQWIADQLDKRGILAGSNIFKEGAIAMCHKMQDEVDNLKSEILGYKQAARMINEEIAILRAGGQSAGEQYRREIQELRALIVLNLDIRSSEKEEAKKELEEVKAERDEYRGVAERLEEHTRSIPKANQLVKAFLSKFTKNTTTP